MEPRTGKTKVAIDFLSILVEANKIDRAVIIAPARVLDVWVEQFYLHCPVRYHLITWDKDARKHPPPKVSGAYDLTVILVNYEAFGTPGKKLASGRRSKTTGRYANRTALEKWLQSTSAACILDESHKVKSPSGRSSTMIVGMRDFFDYRLILTGTPITKAKRVFDIYMQWKFLNPSRFREWPSSDAFKSHFGKWTHRNGYPQFLDTRNVEQLTEYIYRDAYHIKRSDCFDLPPRQDIFRTINLEQRSKDVYDDMAEKMIAWLIDHDGKDRMLEASIPLVVALRLTQITGGYVKDADGEVIPIGREKLDTLAEIFDETRENDEKVVVAARFRAELDAITLLASQSGLECYPVRGGLSRSETSGNIRNFKRSRNPSVLVMNPQAGGVGIDLSAASHMVWYSLPTSWVDYTQACDRIALSARATQFTYLLASGTIDELLYDTLVHDGDVAETILKDPRKVLRK